MDTITITLLIVTLLIFCWLWRRGRGRNLPPGPWAPPLIGNIIGIVRWRDSVGYCEHMRKTYGNICTVWLGPVATVILSGYDNVHEVFVNKADVSSGRPKKINIFQEFSGGNGIMFQDGEPWHDMRRFTLNALRDLGLGNRGTEERILEECSIVLQELDKVSEKVWAGSKLLWDKATCNVITSLVFGMRFGYTDPVFLDLLDKLRDCFKSHDTTHLFDLLPSSFAFLKPKSAESHTAPFVNAINRFAREQIAEHRRTYDVNHSRDLVDIYIKATSDYSEKLTDENLFASITDLFVAGTETTASTLDWAIIYMMEHPGIQSHCQQEIDREVGRKRPVRMEDRARLPYVHATVLEINRHASVAPFGVDHRATEDFKVCGYNIPKNTIIAANLYSVLRDPTYWQEPNRFNPERFIDEDGQIIKYNAWIPFSTGPRTCLGEALARTETFLLFANVIQHFNFTKVSHDDSQSQYTCPSAIRGPVDYKARVTRRD